MKSVTTVPILSLLLFAPVTVILAADAAANETKTVVAGEQYGKPPGGLFFFGKDYRDLWTTPVEVPVLDMQSFAGGLKPVMRIGGNSTKGLALKGADGRDYTFGSVAGRFDAHLMTGSRLAWTLSGGGKKGWGDYPFSLFSNAGRIYFEGEKSGKWHPSYGAGIFYAPFQRTSLYGLKVGVDEDRVFIVIEARMAGFGF